MNKLILLAIFAIVPTLSFCQSTETFDSNTWGWTEYSDDKGDAIIMNGVLHLESKRDKLNDIQDVVNGICSIAYAPLDPQKGFKLSCEAKVDKVDYQKTFGIVLDYKDDLNCIILLVQRDNAQYYRVREGKVVSHIPRQFKLGKQKKAALDISVKYIDGALELRVNDINAFGMGLRNIEIETNGIGFFAFGKVAVDFDNVVVSDPY